MADQKTVKIHFRFLDEHVVDCESTTFMATADRVALERRWTKSFTQIENPTEEQVVFFLWRAAQRVNEEIKGLDFDELIDSLDSYDYDDGEKAATAESENGKMTATVVPPPAEVLTG
jgi:hypothetical protein